MRNKAHSDCITDSKLNQGDKKITAKNKKGVFNNDN